MDNEQLVDQVTRLIMERIAATESTSGAAPQVVTFGEVPECLLGTGLNVRVGHSASDADGADYIVLSQAAFRTFHGGVIPAGLTSAVQAVSASAPAVPAAAASPSACDSCSTVTDLTGKRLISERDIQGLSLGRGASLRVDQNAIVTALARDIIRSQGVQIIH